MQELISLIIPLFKRLVTPGNYPPLVLRTLRPVNQTLLLLITNLVLGMTNSLAESQPSSSNKGFYLFDINKGLIQYQRSTLQSLSLPRLLPSEMANATVDNALQATASGIGTDQINQATPLRLDTNELSLSQKSSGLEEEQDFVFLEPNTNEEDNQRDGAGVPPDGSEIRRTSAVEIKLDIFTVDEQGNSQTNTDPIAVRDYELSSSGVIRRGAVKATAR